MDIPGQSAPWLHRHPSKQRLPSYYGPIRQRTPQPVLHAYGFCLGTLPLAARASEPRPPYRRSPSHVPCKSRRPGSRHLYAGHHLARNAGTRQTHPEGHTRTPGFDAVSEFRRLNSARPPGDRPRPSAFWNIFLVPTWRGHCRAFSLDAPHDSLQLTQLQGGLTPAPAGPTPEGQLLHLSHSSAYIRGLLHDSSFSVRDTRCGSSGVRQNPRICGRSGGQRARLPRVLTGLEPRPSPDVA